jgi:hypothetical protein
MHLGAYFDPGMECNLPENLNELSRAELEKIFDQPFDSDTAGIRIIKSHVFSNHIDFLRATFPEIPIVLVYRPDDACLGWWVKCGHFDITYPLYHSYYQNLKQMSKIIKQQNRGIVNASCSYPAQAPYDNKELCELLNIEPPTGHGQVYEYADIKVVVI